VSPKPNPDDKNAAIEGLVKEAMADPQALQALLDTISPTAKTEATRYASFQALELVAQRSPEALMPHWDYLVSLLASDSGSSKFNALHLLADLAPADRGGRFAEIIDLFFDAPTGEGVTITAHVAATAGAVAKAHPELRSEITRRLLGMDLNHLPPERRGLVRGHMLDSFDQYLDQAEDKEPVLALARRLLGSNSPRSRKCANEFLRKWEKADARP